MCHAGLREHSVELGGSALLKQSITAVRSDYSSVTSRLWGMRRAGLRSFSSRLTFSCFIAEPNVVVGGQGKWDPALPPECQQLLKRPFNWISSCPARLLIESAASRLPQIWTCSIGKPARLASAKRAFGDETERISWKQPEEYLCRYDWDTFSAYLYESKNVFNILRSLVEPLPVFYLLRFLFLDHAKKWVPKRAMRLFMFVPNKYDPT